MYRVLGMGYKRESEQEPSAFLHLIIILSKICSFLMSSVAGYHRLPTILAFVPSQMEVCPRCNEVKKDFPNFVCNMVGNFTL